MLDQEGKNVMFTSLIQNKKKTPQHTSSHQSKQFHTQFQATYHLTLGYIEIEETFQTPTNCRPKNSCMVIMLPQTNINTQHQACLHQTLVCAFHCFSQNTSHSLWIWTFMESHIHGTQNEHSLAKFPKMGKPWNMKNITHIYDCIIHIVNLEFTCVILLTLIYPTPNMHASNLVWGIKNTC